MHVAAHLNIDLLAHDTDEDVTCLVNLQAPTSELTEARPGQTLVIVLDRSGSMAGEPLDGAKKSINALLRRLAPQDAFGLIVFDSSAAVVSPVRAMSDHDMPSLAEAIAGIVTGGTTDISAGYLLALREAKRSLQVTGQRGATILIISDGNANAGIVDPEQLDQLALNAFRTDAITTSTLGLSRHYNELQLVALTRGGGGEHRFAEDIDAAGAEISALVGDLLDKSVVGAQLRIKRWPALVASVLLRDHIPTFMDGDVLVVPLGDMYSAEERSVLVKFLVPGLPSLGTTLIAELLLEYTSMPDLKEHVVTLPIAVNVVPGDDARGRVPNPAVEVAELLADLADEKLLAATALRQGDADGASQTIATGLAKVSTKREELAKRHDVDAALTERIDEALQSLTVMADDLLHRDIEWNNKMVMQAYSSESRGRRQRPRSVDPEA